MDGNSLRGSLVQVTLHIGLNNKVKTYTGILLSHTPVSGNMYDNIHDVEILTDEGVVLGLSLFLGDKLEILNENPKG